MHVEENPKRWYTKQKVYSIMDQRNTHYKCTNTNWKYMHENYVYIKGVIMNAEEQVPAINWVLEKYT